MSKKATAEHKGRRRKPPTSFVGPTIAEFEKSFFSLSPLATEGLITGEGVLRIDEFDDGSRVFFWADQPLYFYESITDKFYIAPGFDTTSGIRELCIRAQTDAVTSAECDMIGLSMEVVGKVVFEDFIRILEKKLYERQLKTDAINSAKEQEGAK